MPRVWLNAVRTFQQIKSSVGIGIKRELSRKLQVGCALWIRGQNLFKQFLRCVNPPHLGVGLRFTGEPSNRIRL